ncbi:MAG: AGE family epimerase/isomerase [Salinibacter sp.]
MAQSSDSLMQGSFWKQQALTQVLPAWTNQGRAPGGLFYAELDRDWTPQDSTVLYPGMVARHVFSYSAAYLMSGTAAHLDRARTAVDFMIQHGWDERYGGWYNAVRRSGTVVDPEKDLFMQIYAATGLALYWIVTRDERARTYLERTRQFIDENAWDDQHGGYVDVLRRDGSVKSSRKDFSPQLAPVSGYLLYLYSATRDTTYLRRAERILNLTLTHMQDDRGWILERYAKDWTFLPDDGKNSHINVGHNLEVAWLLLRLYKLTGDSSYRRSGLALTDRLLDHAFHSETGAWRSKLRRTNLDQYPSTTTWWVQAYGNFLQLYAYHVTGKQRYLDTFRKGARFWTQNFVDSRYGGTVLRAHLSGGVADGAKAVRTKTSYHALEHALLGYLYLDLWVNEAPVTVHYRIKDPRGDRLFPLPIEELSPTIERVRRNGTLQVPPDTVGRALRLPSQGPASLTLEVTPN